MALAEVVYITVFSVVDPFKDFDDGKFKSNYSAYEQNTAKYEDVITTFNIESYEFLTDYNDGENYDFIFVDGDHHPWGVLEDMVLSWRLLKKGGLMIVDDYSWEVPRKGIDAFLSAYEGRYKFLFASGKNCWQYGIEKL